MRLLLLVLIVLTRPVFAEGNALDLVTQTAPWRLTELASEPLPDDINVSIVRIKEGVWGGSAGCNRFTMHITQADGDLFPGPLITTRMACPARQMHVESRFIKAMAQLKTLRATHQELTLLDAQGTVLGRALFEADNVPDPRP